MPNCISNPSAVRASGTAITPALFISTSSRSTDPSTSAAALRTDPRSARSRLTVVGAGPVATAATRSRAASARSGFRQAISTVAPRRASASAEASPSPLLAPVISTVRPVWSGMSAELQRGMALSLPDRGVVGWPRPSWSGMMGPWRSWPWRAPSSLSVSRSRWRGAGSGTGRGPPAPTSIPASARRDAPSDAPSNAPSVRSTAQRYARGVAIALVGGFWAGALVTGPAMRLIMRLLAVTAGDGAQGVLTEADEMVGQIDLDGTISLLIFGGILPGLVSGALYLVVRRLLPGGRLGGVVFGALHLVIGATRIDPLRPDNPDFDLLGPAWASILTFGLACVLHGMAVVAIANRYSRALPPEAPSRALGGRVVPLVLPLALLRR